jgi:hypothetical protein
VCGAAARPFYTHHNALDMDCNLRIAPETYLKQCIAAGYHRVYEVAKCFRNEGMDTEHLQEFTQVEWYASYWNFEDNLKFYQDFIRNLLMELVGTTTITYQGNTLDFGKDFTRININEVRNNLTEDDKLKINVKKNQSIWAIFNNTDDLDEVPGYIVEKNENEKFLAPIAEMENMNLNENNNNNNINTNNNIISSNLNHFLNNQPKKNKNKNINNKSSIKGKSIDLKHNNNNFSNGNFNNITMRNFKKHSGSNSNYNIISSNSSYSRNIIKLSTNRILTLGKMKLIKNIDKISTNHLNNLNNNNNYTNKINYKTNRDKK